MKTIYSASPRGYCAGVRRALEIVERALAFYGPPVYVRNQIVHNDFVVSELERRGVVFVKTLDAVLRERPIIVSAHGAPPEFETDAERRGLVLIDATCPLVKKIHLRAKRRSDAGDLVILIGHPAHPEIVGALGWAGKHAVTVEKTVDVSTLKLPASRAKIACLTQTTLCREDTREIVEALRRRFADRKFVAFDNICYASENRQNAVKSLAPLCDVIFVLGSPRSSNSNRLAEVARKAGARAYLVNGPEEVVEAMLENVGPIGVTAGASAPEILVEKLIAKLESWGWKKAKNPVPAVSEDIQFPAPRTLPRKPAPHAHAERSPS